LYLQQFVRHAGWDLRAFVLAGRVLTAMRRCSRGDWRTNIAQGGTAEPVNLSRDDEALALRAAEALSTSVAGVDLLPGPKGERYVIEVNAVPGWRALAPATGVDVAAAVLKHLVEGEW
jgi:ribosomal protein S6--L-glutamate ligase